MPNLKNITVGNDSSELTSSWEEIDLNFQFNLEKERSNWFILHSLIFHYGVEISIEFECFDVNWNKMWLKEIKQNKCFLKFKIDDQYFSFSYAFGTEIFLEKYLYEF